MEELALTITYRGETLEMPVEAYKYGHTYRIGVKVDEQIITFEPDEEGSYRAFADPKTDKDLIAAIAAELENLK